MRFRRRKAEPAAEQLSAVREWHDDTPDPLGKDTLGPGDPIYDNLFGPMMRGEITGPVMAVRDEEGNYRVTELGGES